MHILEDELYSADIRKALSYYDFSELEGKTIFVTGASGLICSSIVDILLELRKKGTTLKVFAAGRDIEKINKRFLHQVVPYQYEATKQNTLPENIDYIIHGAGYSSPELYTSNPVETLLSNIIGVNTLLDYCINQKTRMVYISSSEVYGKKEVEGAFDESNYGYINQDNIRNSYSESKRAAEMLCRAYSKEFGVTVCMVRPGHVYGPTASIKDKRISSEFAYKAAKGEDLIMLSSGMQRRSYCYCVDCACAILLCLINGKSGEAYNIGTNETTSIKEMASYLSEAGKVNLMANEPSEEEKSAFNPMNNSALSNEKIQKIGYRQIFSSKVGLEHTVSIIKRCAPF